MVINMSQHSKIDSKYENPIDIIMYKISAHIEPYFLKLNMTPNHITTLSLICGLLCVYYLDVKTSNIGLAVTFYMLSFLFDCLDGYYARKNNMLSKLGDMYDHYTDLLVHIMIYYMLYKRLSKDRFIYFNVLLVILLVGLAVQMGCQEKKYEEKVGKDKSKKHSSYLNILKPLCVNPDKTMLISKFFGSGTTTILFAIFILLVNK